MEYFLGLDIGSINVKVAVIEANGTALYFDAKNITSNPKEAINCLLHRLNEKIDLELISAVGLSGAGKTIVPDTLQWAEYSSSLSIATGLLQSHPEVRTIIQIGGHSSLIIGLKDKLQQPWKVDSNPLCAAGTGLFLEQQAYRLGISLEDFTALALKHRGNAPRIAARCSVFAKSDLIHLQQQGAPIEAICYALCESIARTVASQSKGVYEEPVFFVGGVAANTAITKAIQNILSAKYGHSVAITVPADYLYLESLGAALLSRDKHSKAKILPDMESQQHYYKMPPLVKSPVPKSKPSLNIKNSCNGYLGIDIGSTSTKAVILDESGKQIIAKNYLMTAGRPVEAVKQVFRNLHHSGANNVNIAAVGVTGSGRYLIGRLVGADIIKNEITAQTRAAAEIDPEADIIELGGQDSKLVIKRNGLVVDYQMNKACAAGTGSFIDEMAETLGVSVKNGDFAKLAFAAQYTIDLGTKCTAFMSQAVVSAQRDGVPIEVITASLAKAIVNNYLTKVLGTRKLGSKVILTGAVFYNEAIVAAFRQELKGNILSVAEHREVSGAIGVALLAKENSSNKPSKFIGLPAVVENDCELSVFNCERCDNHCAITQMKIPDENPSFYGSRCDRYDGEISHTRRETYFDEREKLLFREYHEMSLGKPIVGIPRALVIYDYAPLLIAFLNSLGAKTVISNQTNKAIIEMALESGYSDSCFPLKLLHGHIHALKNTDYILYPSAIRLGMKEGEENQQYACPLVQASPYIVRTVLNLQDRLLIPTLDFSLGDKEVIENLTSVAVRMGFSQKKSKEAALVGLENQRIFEAGKKSRGKAILQQLHNSGQIGVVLLTRSYISQDSGANLAISQKLTQLGVIPIPLDFLPLDSVDITKYSDRPYWSYEAKFIAGAAITAADPQLYALVLTNFGCGPNSFILKIVEDIMGGKPLGQLEIDEHAAEAGIVTRLEAFVDTLQGHAHSGRQINVPASDIYRGAQFQPESTRTVLIPRMAANAHAIAATMQAFNIKAIVLPEPNERNLFYANQVTSGTECLPFRVTLGDFMRFYYENPANTHNFEGFMVGSFGPCRLGKYAVEHMKILREIGFDLPLRLTVSNNAYGDFRQGPAFERLMWRGIVAVDYLQKMLLRVRPYERQKGYTDRLFDQYLTMVIDHIREKKELSKLLRQASSEFTAIIQTDLPRRPLIGINGEAFLRANNFSNKDLAKVCEEAGLEVVLSPVTEWINYTSFRKLEDAIKNRNIPNIIKSYLRKAVLEYDEKSIAKCFDLPAMSQKIHTSKLLTISARYLSPRCGSEAVLSLGSGIEWMENTAFAGVISVMPHGCMPGGIVAAMAESFGKVYSKPWISLTYDGFQESNNLSRIIEFAELVKFCNRSNSQTSFFAVSKG